MYHNVKSVYHLYHLYHLSNLSNLSICVKLYLSWFSVSFNTGFVCPRHNGSAKGIVSYWTLL